MGHFPTDRTKPEPPFTTVGVDFAGPLSTTRGNPRKPTIVKTYVCLFICFSIKAVNLELCCDLSTENFVAAFQRFSNRRGLPSHIYCNNGKNFVGAARELSEINNLLQSPDIQQAPSSHLLRRYNGNSLRHVAHTSADSGKLE